MPVVNKILFNKSCMEKNIDVYVEVDVYFDVNVEVTVNLDVAVHMDVDVSATLKSTMDVCFSNSGWWRDNSSRKEDASR